MNSPVTPPARRMAVSWPLLFLLLLAFLLRLYRLDFQSLWWDEGISLHLATSSWTDITLNRLNNIHPPLYFYLLNLWVDLVGVTPFAARYSSLLASWLQVPLIYAVAHRWFGRSAARLAALLVAVSPLSIIYAQEVRVYAFLPLIYLLLLASTRTILRGGQARRSYLLYGVTAWVGIHFHYITFFVLAYLNLWAAVVLLKPILTPSNDEARRAGRQALKRWTSLQVAVGLCSLPWFGAVVWNATAVSAEANAGTFATDPVPFTFLLRQIWLFHLTGLPQAAGWQTAVLLAALLALLVLFLLFMRLRQTSPATLIPLAHWLIPLAAALSVWLIRPFAHPRYITMIAIGLPLLIAALLQPHSLTIDNRELTIDNLFFRSAKIVTLALLLTLAFLGYTTYTFDPATAKDDMRGVARYLETAASPTDLILIPDTDYSLLFEYQGDTPIKMPGLEDPAVTPADWTAWTNANQQIHLVDYPRGTRDWQQRVSFALEVAGTRLNAESFDGLVVHTYQLDQPLTQLTERPFPTPYRFGQIELISLDLPQQTPANSALPVQLTWRLRAPVASDISASLRLDNGQGWQLGVVDDRLLDENGRPTSQWPANQPITTYHRLVLPAGSPPLDYTLSLSTFALDEAGSAQPLELLDAQGAGAGQIASLGTTTLSPAASLSGDPYGVADAQPEQSSSETAANLTLRHFSSESSEVIAGRRVQLDLLWEVSEETAVSPPAPPALQLWQNDSPLGEPVPLIPDHPPAQWQAGEQLRWQFGYRIPPTASGTAVLQLQYADQTIPLQPFTITPVDYQLTPPDSIDQPVEANFGDVARLIGVTLPDAPLAPPGPFAVTLFWQSLADEIRQDYVVFVQLLDENGRVVAQSDSQPVQGTRPTTSWIAGEYLTDEHQLTFRETQFSGETRLIVGLYEVGGGNGRLLTEDGSDFFDLGHIDEKQNAD